MIEAALPLAGLDADARYALNVAEELAYSLADIDAAMRAGYRWRWGPFELLDALGPAAFAERLKAEGQVLPKLLEQVGEGYFYRTGSGPTRGSGL